MTTQKKVTYGITKNENAILFDYCFKANAK